MQFPALSRDYDVLQWQPDRSNANAGGDHAGLVSKCAYIARESERRDIFLMGESFGGVQALDVALRANEHLAGVIAVNPATSFPHRSARNRRGNAGCAGLAIRALSAWLFERVSATRSKRAPFSSALRQPDQRPGANAAGARRVPERGHSRLAAGFSTPRDYFLQRLSSLGPAAESVNAALEAEAPPRSAARRSSLSPAPRTAWRSRARARGYAACLATTRAPCTVEGALGTLDDRIDLRQVEDWRSGRPQASRLSRRPPPPPRSAACRG